MEAPSTLLVLTVLYVVLTVLFVALTVLYMALTVIHEAPTVLYVALTVLYVAPNLAFMWLSAKMKAARSTALGRDMKSRSDVSRNPRYST